MLGCDWDLWFRRLEGKQCVLNPATQHQKNPHLLWKEGKKQFGNNWANLQKRVVEIFVFVTTKPRDIRQLASECSQIMAGVYYVVTLAT